MKRTVKILSGIPGCGKSTYAELLDHENEFGPAVYVVSADKFHIDDDGEYRFNPSKIGEAHAECMNDFLHLLQIKNDCTVVVDNTGIHRWERRNYLHAANIMGWDVELHFWLCRDIEDIRACYNRQTHGVPVEVVFRMAFEHEVDTAADNCIFHTIDKMIEDKTTPPEYVTLQDAAKAFGLEPVSRQAMVNWTRDGVKSRDGKRNVVLQSRLMGREVKTTLEWFDEWIEERSKPTEENET